MKANSYKKKASDAKDLAALRSEIDFIDGRIVELLGHRVKMVSRIFSLKKSLGMPVFDRGREKQVLWRVEKLSHPPITPAFVNHVFKAIMREGRRYYKESKKSK